MAARARRELSPQATAVVERLRDLCVALADTSEGLSFGNSTFRAGGRPFLVLDCYRGQECLWLRVARSERADIAARPGWFPSPYDPQAKALCCALEKLDWRRLPRLVRGSHALALAEAGAPKTRARSSARRRSIRR